MAKSPSRRIAPHVAVINGTPTTTSRDIAETFGKRHADVLERIRKLDCSPAFIERNFSFNEYTDPIGRTLAEYRITRDGFAFLCMGFTGAKAAKWKERYIATFNKLADKVAARIAPKTLPAPVALPAPGVDVRALLLSGQSAPEALPPVLEQAIDKKAWVLAHEAYELLRQHMQRRVPYRHTYGHPVRQLHLASALDDIQSLTLGQALAHTAISEMQGALNVARAAAFCTQEAVKRIQEQVGEAERGLL